MNRFSGKASTLLALLLASVAAVAVAGRGKLVRSSAAAQSYNDAQMVAEDERRFPHLMAFLKQADIRANEPAPYGNEHLFKAPKVFHPAQPFWDAFFKAAVADRITNLRAFGLIARRLKQSGATMFGPGQDLENAVHMNHIDVGLALPDDRIGLGVWEPDSTVSDPEFQLHLTVVYTERYIHQFPDEVMPINLKIGYGDETEYYVDGQKHHGYLLTADYYYGPHGIGFKNVHGVSGESRGIPGVFQKLFFFLPDAIHSMMIDEKRNAMVTEALINSSVEGFETRDIYRMRYRR